MSGAMEFLMLDAISPWLGGGAVAAAAMFTMWLWLTYFRRDNDQRDRDKEQREAYEKILEDTRQDRDYWRDMAISRQKSLVEREDLIDEFKRQNAALERRNDLLSHRIKILEKEKSKLIEALDRYKPGD